MRHEPLPRIKIDNRRPLRYENLVTLEVNTEMIDVTYNGLFGGPADMYRHYIPGPTTCTLVFKDHIDTYGRVSWKKDVDGEPLLCLRELIGNVVL